MGIVNMGVTGVLVASLGCGQARDEPPAATSGPLWTGIAAADCAPWDGSATSLYLSDSTDADQLPPPPPYLHLIVYASGGGLPGRRVDLGRLESGSGLAARCESGGECATSNSGTVTFEDPGQVGTLSGSFELDFAGDTLAGIFLVRWSSRGAMCG